MYIKNCIHVFSYKYNGVTLILISFFSWKICSYMRLHIAVYLIKILIIARQYIVRCLFFVLMEGEYYFEKRVFMKCFSRETNKQNFNMYLNLT